MGENTTCAFAKPELFYPTHIFIIHERSQFNRWRRNQLLWVREWFSIPLYTTAEEDFMHSHPLTWTKFHCEPQQTMLQFRRWIKKIIMFKSISTHWCWLNVCIYTHTNKHHQNLYFCYTLRVIPQSNKVQN